MTKRLLLLLGLVLGSGCASSETYESEDYDPKVPLRVAVLPFVDDSSGDSYVSAPVTAALDIVPILSSERFEKGNAAMIYRSKMQANLYRTQLDLIDLRTIDTILDHEKIDPKSLYAKGADRRKLSRELGRRLGVDAVMFGRVTEWDRDYYLVESVVHAGLEVELRDATSGGVLYWQDERDYEASGISKIPITYSPDGAAQAVLGESLKGLRNTLFLQLSDDVTRRIAEGLSVPAEQRSVAPAPVVRFVAHNFAQELKEGLEISVVAIGTPGCRATMRLDYGREFPMTETGPGTYRGSVKVGRSIPFVKNRALRVRLVNKDLIAAASRTEFKAIDPTGEATGGGTSSGN